MWHLQQRNLTKGVNKKFGFKTKREGIDLMKDAFMSSSGSPSWRFDSVMNLVKSALSPFSVPGRRLCFCWNAQSAAF